VVCEAVGFEELKGRRGLLHRDAEWDCPSQFAHWCLRAQRVFEQEAVRWYSQQYPLRCMMWEGVRFCVFEIEVKGRKVEFFIMQKRYVSV